MFKANRGYVKLAQVLKGPVNQHLCWSCGPFVVQSLIKPLILYMYIAPGQGQKTPWGQTFDVNIKPLSLRPSVASVKQIFLNSDFIHIF